MSVPVIDLRRQGPDAGTMFGMTLGKIMGQHESDAENESKARAAQIIEDAKSLPPDMKTLYLQQAVAKDPTITKWIAAAPDRQKTPEEQFKDNVIAYRNNMLKMHPELANDPTFAASMQYAMATGLNPTTEMTQTMTAQRTLNPQEFHDQTFYGQAGLNSPAVQAGLAGAQARTVTQGEYGLKEQRLQNQAHLAGIGMQLDAADPYKNMPAEKKQAAAMLTQQIGQANETLLKMKSTPSSDPKDQASDAAVMGTLQKNIAAATIARGAVLDPQSPLSLGGISQNGDIILIDKRTGWQFTPDVNTMSIVPLNGPKPPAQAQNQGPAPGLVPGWATGNLPKITPQPTPGYGPVGAGAMTHGITRR